MTSASVEAALAAIAERDGEVGAFVGVDADGARGHRTSGPLAGVPVAVKELFAVRGQPWTAGSRTRAGVVAAHDAAAVTLLREAGAAVVGVTRTHEWAWGLATWHERLGGCRNPWSLDRICGGSSGGSAAAVAAGMVPVALGTDTGCSIRLPAAFCGVVGFKPTHGLLPLDGVLPLSPSFDHVGVIGREVSDVARVTLVLGGLPIQSRRDLSGLVVGVPELPGIGLPRDRAAALDAASAALGRLGAQLVPVDLPDPATVAEAYATVQGLEALRYHRDVLGSWPAHRDAYGSDVRQHLERAAARPDGDYERGVMLTLQVRAQTSRVLREVDLLLSPVAACGPPSTMSPHEAWVDGRPVPLRDAVLPYTQVQDVCGLPACSVPAGLDAQGLPVGVQLSGRPWADGLVLAASRLLRDSLRDRLPPRPTGMAT